MTDASADDLLFIAKTMMEAEEVIIRTRDGKEIVMGGHLREIIDSLLRIAMGNLLQLKPHGASS